MIVDRTIDELDGSVIAASIDEGDHGGVPGEDPGWCVRGIDQGHSKIEGLPGPNPPPGAEHRPMGMNQIAHPTWDDAGEVALERRFAVGGLRTRPLREHERPVHLGDGPFER